MNLGVMPYSRSDISTTRDSLTPLISDINIIRDTEFRKVRHRETPFPLKYTLSHLFHPESTPSQIQVTQLQVPGPGQVTYSPGS